MKKKILFLLTIAFSFFTHADEGMWLPLFLNKNEADMQKLGMKITAKDIYDVNHTSLKDAIVQFGQGCTGEFVSDKGLLFTNHHCGYSHIVSLSSVENNYLANGFWAENLQKELPCPGLTVTLLIRMEDVTTKVLEGVSDNMTQENRTLTINTNIAKLKKQAVEGTHYTADIFPFYYGNQYFLYVNEVFHDVRLVGAPPSNIGKFGGETDNWMWPRHTGDFSVFRVYASKDNKPAKYSKDNVPYQPKKHLTISLSELQQDEFTFVFGYPGRTQEYLTSYAVDQTVNILNPAKIELRNKRLEIYNAAMNQSADQRLRYASSVAGIANGWKKMIGESKGIHRLNGVEKKQAFEKQFTEWVNQDSKRKAEYGNLLPEFAKQYARLQDFELAKVYSTEAFGASDFMSNVGRVFSISENCKKSQSYDTTPAYKLHLERITRTFEDYTKHRIVDKDIFVQTLKIYYEKIDSRLLPPAFSVVKNKYDNNIEAFANDLFEKSAFSSKEKLSKMLAECSCKNLSKLTKDPAFSFYAEVKNYYDTAFPQSHYYAINDNLNSLYKKYMKAMMEMQPKKAFYPDANFTLRVAYGKVDGYEPFDGAIYKYYTTIEGIMQKENPNIFDYVVEPKLKELYQEKNYGIYANKKGEMPVAFIATNHTTGGNSGSPVLNSKGELIGINYDRCWEGTMSDIMYDPSQCRNIALDVRYCLFIIDKFANAKHLVDEMTIVK